MSRAKLNGMSFNLKLDRVIDYKNDDLLCSGFEINGKSFDFIYCEITEQDEETCVIKVEMDEYDDETAEDNGWKSVTKKDAKTGIFSEFHVYYGWYDNPIKVNGISNIIFHFDDGSEVRSREETVRSATESMTKDGGAV